MIPAEQVWWATIVSGIVTAILTISAVYLLYIARQKKGSILLKAISSSDDFPSLANLQLFMWSIVIVFSFFAVYMVRVLGGFYDPPAGILPENILKIMGISAIVPAASLGLNNYKHPKVPNAPSLSQSEDSWSSILLEADSSSITRLQMFMWTWIGILIYVIAVFGSLYALTLPTSTTLLNQVKLPDVDSTLLALMGISQGAFVAGKATSPKKPVPEAPLPKG